MKKYSVQVMEITTHWVDVDADNVDDAKDSAERIVDEGNFAGWNYSVEAHDVLEVKHTEDPWPEDTGKDNWRLER